MLARPLALGIVALLVVLVTDAARAAPPAATPITYDIRATLDPATHRVAGIERIHFTNRSRRPLTELWFHLYLNAFESDATVFMRESSGHLRGVGAKGRGSIEVLGLRLADGTDLLAAARTDVGAADDRTEMRVPLPASIPPGGSLDLEVLFTAYLPPLFARSGHSGDFHVVAQWYPKLARLEPDGRWATFPYHGNGEFYADFAHHTLTVTVPEAFVVAAVGAPMASSVREGLRTLRFEADRVHDTMFVAAPDLRESRRRHGEVVIHFLAPPGYERLVERQLALVERGLSSLERRLVPYPYRHLWVVLPPRGAEGGAGMEYPTLFLTAGEWFDASLVRLDGADITTAHELAHQWFQGMIASDEVRWPMLDEGLTSWAGMDLLRRIHGTDGSALSVAGLTLDSFEVCRFLALTTGASPPPGRPVTDFTAHEYGRAIYARVPVVLETIARVWGRDRLDAALGRYAREQAFRHPEPEDLFGAFDAVYWPGFSDAILRPALMENADAEVKLASVETAPGGQGTTVTVERVGSLPVPLWVALEHPDGSATRVPWPGSERRLVHTSPRPVRAVVVDPDRHDLLDPRRLPDARRVEAGPPPSAPWFGRSLTWAMTLLAGVQP